MSRLARLDAPEVLHHLMGRGIQLVQYLGVTNSCVTRVGYQGKDRMWKI